MGRAVLRMFIVPAADVMRELGWDKATLMGAFTLGLATWGAATYAVGAAIDRGLGQRVLTVGAPLAGEYGVTVLGLAGQHLHAACVAGAASAA